MDLDRFISSLQDVAKQASARFRRASPRRSAKAPPLPSAIDAERTVISTLDAGTISYYADDSGHGRPIVLIHGVHAAASAYEMRSLFEAFRGERPVYALDLPGFGFSQRGGIEYTPATYVHAIEHLLRHIADERADDRADLVALSLGCEFAALVAADMPELVHSLVLISPTGFGTARETDVIQRRARRGKAPKRWQGLTLAGGALLHSTLVSRPSLKHFLKKSFAGDVDPSLLEYAYATSHQPGAEHAPLAFLGGRLFPQGDPKRIYARVKLPALVLYDRDPHTGFGALRSFAQRHPNYEPMRVLRTCGLPQIEARHRTIQALRSFWQRVEANSEAAEEAAPRSREQRAASPHTHMH